MTASTARATANRHILISTFPPIDKSACKRYQFEKEKEQREARARKLKRDRETYKHRFDSHTSFARELNTALTSVSRPTIDLDRSLEPFLPAQVELRLISLVNDMREEFKRIGTIGRSMLRFSEVMSGILLKRLRMHLIPSDRIPATESPSEDSSRNH